MKIKGSLSIKQRVVATLLLTVVAFVFFVGLYINFLQQLAAFRKSEAEIERLAYDLTLLRVYEGAFFQNDLQSNTFYFDEYSENTASFKDQHQNLVLKLERFDKRFVAKKGAESKVQNLISAINEYNDVFFELVGRLREYGNSDYGLVNKLVTVQAETERIAVHNIKIPLVTQRLESLANYQQNFLETGNLAVWDNFEHKITGLDVVTTAFPEHFFGGAKVKKYFLVKLREYAKWFSLVVEKKKIIGKNTRSGLFLDLLERYKKVDADLEVLREEWLLEIQNQRRNLIVGASAFVFVVFAGMLLLYLLVSTAIIRPLRVLQEQTKKLAKGLLPNSISGLHLSDINEVAKSLNNFVDGLREKVQFSKKIGEGDFTANLEVLGESDQLGASLLDMRDKLLQANQENLRNRKEESRRNWLNEGTHRVSDVMRLYSDDLNSLAGKVVRTLVQYLDAVQAGFYSLDAQDHEVLQLIAAYAYDREKFQQKSFRLGEGLVGAVGAEKEMLHLNKIPEDYLELASTFGVSKPSHLVVIPLVLEDELHGVIEIASFNRFESHHIELIERVAKDITSSLASVKINQKTLSLLAESKKKSEQLDQKEQDIAKNLAQLETAREELQNKELEAQALLKSVDLDLLRVELDLKARVNEMNTKLLSSFKAEQSEFKGRMLDTFLPTVSEAVFSAKWRKLITEEKLFQLETLFRSKKHQIWVLFYFFPVRGKDNMLTRVQVIGFDLSEFKLRESLLQNRMDEYTAEHNKREDEKLKLKKQVAKLEKEVISKDIEYQTTLLEKKNLEEEFDVLHADNKKITLQNDLKEERIAHVRSRLDLIMNTMTIGIVMVSSQGFITFVNQKLSDLVEGSINKIVNKRFSETLFAFDPFKLKTEFGYEATLNKLTGSHADVRITVVRLEEDDMERLIFVEDLTSSKNRQKDYLEEKERMNNEVARLHNKIRTLEQALKDKN